MDKKCKLIIYTNGKKDIILNFEDSKDLDLNYDNMFFTVSIKGKFVTSVKTDHIDKIILKDKSDTIESGGDIECLETGSL